MIDACNDQLKTEDLQYFSLRQLGVDKKNFSGCFVFLFMNKHKNSRVDGLVPEEIVFEFRAHSLSGGRPYDAAYLPPFLSRPRCGVGTCKRREHSYRR